MEVSLESPSTYSIDESFEDSKNKSADDTQSEAGGGGYDMELSYGTFRPGHVKKE